MKIFTFSGITHYWYKMFLSLLLPIVLLIVPIINLSATTYYSKGNLAANTLANWNSDRDGISGTAPSNFTTAGDVFVVQGTGNGGTTPHAMTVGSTMTIGSSSNNTKLLIETGASLTATSALTIASAGQFEIQNGGTYTHNHTGAYTAILGGIENFDVNSNFIIQNSSSTGPGTPSNGGFGNLIINSTTYSSSVNSAGALTAIKGNLKIVATGTGTNEFRLTGATAMTLSIGGDLIIEGGVFTLGNGTASPIINLSGNIQISGGRLNYIGTTNPSTATINLVKNGTQTFTKTGGSITALNSNGRRIAFVVGNNTILDMGNSILDCASGNNVDLIVNSGATLKISDSGGIATDGTSGNVQTSTTSLRTFSSDANYEYSGSVAQVTGTGLPSTVAQLKINNSSAEGVSLSSPITVKGTLTLSDGVLNIGNSDLTLGASASIVSATSSNYIVTDGTGKLTMPVSAGVATLFPVGASTSSYDPVSINPTDASIFSVKVGTTLSGSPASGYQYNQKEWDITPASPSATVLSFTPSAVTATGQYNIIGHYVDGDYVNKLSTTQGGNIYTGTFSTFSPFVTGTSDTPTATNSAKTGLFVSVNGSNAYLNGTVQGQLISIYGTNGQLVKNLEASENFTALQLNKGIFLVKVNNEVIKVVL